MSVGTLRQLVLFGCSGVLAFIVDVLVFQLLFWPTGSYAARLPSFLAAATTTWLFNRTITFQEARRFKSLSAEYAAYVTSASIGGAVNVAFFYLLVGVSTFFAAFPMLAIAAGSLSGMAFNFIASRLILVKK